MKKQKNKFFSYNFFPKNRKAYYFSLDAFIALVVILGVVLFIKPHSTEVIYEMDIQQDLLDVLSNLKIGEIDNSVAQSLIFTGEITNLNQSVLEQIGEFYANSDNANATLLADSILNGLGLNENIGLYFSGQDIAVYNTTDLESAEDVWTSRQVISGIQRGESVTGFSSIAFLSAENKVKYFYFGGYVGDGNITLDIGQDVESVKVEAVFSGDFDLSLNGNSPTSHTPTLGQPYEVILSTGFVTGDNYLYFTSGNNLYIAGGFVKVVYNNSFPPQSTNTYKFPGIEGLINIYDSFYIPGVLNSIEVFLNFTSPYNIFFSIANKTLYSGNDTNKEVILTDSTLSGLLDYSSMNDKTIPFRLGFEGVSYITNETNEIDVFSVTDLSASMNANAGGGLKVIDIVKMANKAFMMAVLNYSENRVGLVGYNQKLQSGNDYYNDYLPEDYHALSRNKISLENKIDSWTTKAGTCICCGIIKATQALLNESNPSKTRSMVVMTDGKANEACWSSDAAQDAIDAACDAYSYNITVYALGFGSDIDEETLQDIGITCGHGGYYYGSIDELVDIYKQIAQDIINAAYYEQTIVAEGVYAELYPSSYISVDYDRTIPYGLLITAESEEFGVTAPVGNFSLPFDAVPYEAQVVSYSGSKWTSLVEVYDNVSGVWESVFDLSEYGSEYTELGDPYVIDIPSDKIRQGENSVRVYLGLAPDNLTDGSQYNKVIYSVFKNISGFSPIVSFAEGCIWTIEFEDTTTSVMTFPADYTGVVTCSYTSTSVAYNPNDAIDVAVFDLLSAMDLNSNQRIETKFTENDLTITSAEVEGIPFVWETEVQVRVWR